MSDTAANKLELVAALAKDAASKLRQGKYWPRELPDDLARIKQAIQDVEREIADTEHARGH